MHPKALDLDNETVKCSSNIAAPIWWGGGLSLMDLGNKSKCTPKLIWTMKQ
jgi:hypothetical protein